MFKILLLKLVLLLKLIYHFFFLSNNYDNLISSPSIDIVYVALPNSFHASYINKSIEQKKSVLVEKPAFTNLQDFLTCVHCVFQI